MKEGRKEGAVVAALRGGGSEKTSVLLLVVRYFMDGGGGMAERAVVAEVEEVCTKANGLEREREGKNLEVQK